MLLSLQELREEATDASAALYIHKDILERVLMGRLMLDLPDYPQWPVFYLLGCYDRASVEYRKLSSSANPKDVVIAEALLFCKKLIVSYVGLSLLHDMFPAVRPKSNIYCQKAASWSLTPVPCANSRPVW